MTLLQLCEPLFQYVCTLNREARSGSRRDYVAVRADVKRLIEEQAQVASRDVRLAGQAKKVELPLVFFVDSMICQSQSPAAAQWSLNRLAKEKYNELAGDDRFFVLLRETLEDHTEDASERLAVFYQCLWLGFTGPYDRKPDKLRECVDEIRPRIGAYMDSDPKRRICEEAYRGVDRRPLDDPRSNRLAILGILFAFLCIAVMVVYYALYMNASQSVRQSLKIVRGQAQGQ
jgi:type VI secretion system protein ImpK